MSWLGKKDVAVNENEGHRENRDFYKQVVSIYGKISRVALLIYVGTTRCE